MAVGLLRGFLFLSLSSRTFPVEFPFPSARMRLEEVSARSLSSSRPLRWPHVFSRSWGTGSPVGTAVDLCKTIQNLAFCFGGIGMEMLSVEPWLGAEGLGRKWKKRLVESCYVSRNPPSRCNTAGCFASFFLLKVKVEHEMSALGRWLYLCPGKMRIVWVCKALCSK